MIRISNTKKEQLGGFRSLEIIKLTDVLNCPHILTNENANQFTYKQFFESDISILPVNETINMVAKPVRTASGIKYKATAGFEVKYLDAAVDSIFNEYHLQHVIVKGNTFNNNAIIYGSLHFPLKFYYEVLHSKQLENPSKFIISCSAEIPQKPVIL
jgi:hypothetical protein